MGLQTILVLTIALLAIQSALCQEWEYGNDNPVNVIVFYEKGQISLLEKVKEIYVNVSIILLTIRLL